jgi:hypothetical protein
MKIDPLDGILARSRLSGPTRDRIFEAALASAGLDAAAKARKRWRWALAVAFSGVALAGFLLFVPPAAEHMSAKGGPKAAPLVHVECSDSASSSCGPDAMLVFRVEGTTIPCYLSAYAVPRAGGERIWIFPMADGTAPQVAAAEGPRVLSQGARARSLPPGKYDVRVVLSKRLLGRAEVETAADVLTRSTSPIEVRR